MPGRSKHPTIPLRPNAGSVSNSEEYIFSDNTIGYNGSYFKIAPTSVRIEMSNDVIDTTGEFSGNLSGSLVVETEMSKLNYIKGRLIMQGDVPSSTAIGLANLETVEHLDVAFLLGVGATRHFSSVETKALRVFLRIVPESIVVDWNLERPAVGITIIGSISEKYTGKTHPIEEVSETL